jgi:hypothetical protein
MCIEGNRTRTPLGALWVVTLVTALSACGGAEHARPADATPSAIAYHPVFDYLPLLDKTVMSFETETEGSDERGLLIMQVRRPRPSLVELNIGGKTRRLDLSKQGVKLVQGGWLLKTPLQVGATFVGMAGNVRVSSTTREISVPAGHYKECVETVEISPETRTTTTFCPLVGIVQLEVDSMSVQHPERVTARLKSHGPLVDLGGDRVQIRTE